MPTIIEAEKESQIGISSVWDRSGRGQIRARQVGAGTQLLGNIPPFVFHN
jgi:hypothetical protein